VMAYPLWVRADTARVATTSANDDRTTQQLAGIPRVSTEGKRGRRRPSGCAGGCAEVVLLAVRGMVTDEDGVRADTDQPARWRLTDDPLRIVLVA
jgi:hypothetical protein